MDFDEWLAYGYQQNWVSNDVCHTHDGVPMSAEECEQFEEDDPCIHILRLYPNRDVKIAVEANNLPNIKIDGIEDFKLGI